MSGNDTRGRCYVLAAGGAERFDRLQHICLTLALALAEYNQTASHEYEFRLDRRLRPTLISNSRDSCQPQLHGDEVAHLKSRIDRQGIATSERRTKAC